MNEVKEFAYGILALFCAVVAFCSVWVALFWCLNRRWRLLTKICPREKSEQEYALPIYPSKRDKQQAKEIVEAHSEKRRLERDAKSAKADDRSYDIDMTDWKENDYDAHD